MVPGPRRTMPHMTRQEWRDLCTTRCPPNSTPANRRTFDRTYRGWKKRLAIATYINLGKCVTCENLKDMRRQRCLPEHKDAAAHAQRQLVDVVIRDCRADSLVQGLAQESLMVSNSVGHWGRTILNYDVDWMDQAKFRCPRNTSVNKQLADMR